MGIARQLLSHGFLVAALLLVLLGYIFRDDLFIGEATDKANPGNNNTTSLVDEAIENGETVVLTAEVAIAESASSEQLVEKVKSLDSQSAYRPDIEPAPVHVDIDEEINKVAPPLAELKDETQANVATSAVVSQTGSNTITDIVDSNRAVESQDIVETDIDVTEQSIVSHSNDLVANPVIPSGQAPVDKEGAPGYVETASTSRVNEVGISNELADTNINPVVPARPSSAYQNTAPQETEEQTSLRHAREAFWNGDIKSAIEKYEALIVASPDNPDFYGELGNIYYANRKWSEAAVMYYEAGVRLKSREQYGPAMQMVSILRRLQSEKADILEKSVSEAAWPAQE